MFEGPPQQVYVGETGRGLRRRWRDYERGAGKSTASRMHVRLLEHATKGAAVHVERMDKVVVMVDGAKTDPALLPLPFLRKLLENAALAQAAVAGLGIVNGDGYPTSPPSAALGSSAR